MHDIADAFPFREDQSNDVAVATASVYSNQKTCGEIDLCPNVFTCPARISSLLNLLQKCLCTFEQAFNILQHLSI